MNKSTSREQLKSTFRDKFFERKRKVLGKRKNEKRFMFTFDLMKLFRRKKK